MNTMRTFLTGLSLVAAPSMATEPPAVVEMPAEAPIPVVDAAPPQAAADALPPMNFYASVAGNELFLLIKAAPAFARVEKELVGSPIQLRVTHSLQPTAGGQAAGLLSAIWAGGTLGLLPVVTNNNLVLSYEIRVNGQEIVRYDFTRVPSTSGRSGPTRPTGSARMAWSGPSPRPASSRRRRHRIRP